MDDIIEIPKTEYKELIKLQKKYNKSNNKNIIINESDNNIKENIKEEIKNEIKEKIKENKESIELIKTLDILESLKLNNNDDDDFSIDEDDQSLIEFDPNIHYYKSYDDYDHGSDESEVDEDIIN